MNPVGMKILIRVGARESGKAKGNEEITSELNSGGGPSINQKKLHGPKRRIMTEDGSGSLTGGTVYREKGLKDNIDPKGITWGCRRVQYSAQV